MRKEFDMMLIVVVCAILGIICAAVINLLYTQGVVINSIVDSAGITINSFEFLVFFVWLVAGIIIGVMKN